MKPRSVPPLFRLLAPCILAFLALFALVDVLALPRVQVSAEPAPRAFEEDGELPLAGEPLFGPIPWISDDNDDSLIHVLGDINNDGLLDLVVGNGSVGANKVYLNVGGVLETIPFWTSSENDKTNGMALGDVNDDGWLDLAVGNDCAGQGSNCHSIRVYLNVGGTFETTASWTSGVPNVTYSVAWGDVNGDGRPDLAVGNNCMGQANCHSVAVYLNVGGALEASPSWTPETTGGVTRSVAWGDMNGDGLLDLAVGNECTGQANCHSLQVYLNVGGSLEASPSWTPETTGGVTRSVAWGDVNGDGLPELAAGNLVNPSTGARNSVYLNVGGMLEQDASWESDEADITLSVAFGDVDSDGDLDLAVGNNGPNRVYLNVDGVLEPTYFWTDLESDQTRSVAFGDVDGDGDLDLALANNGAANLVYLNVRGVLERTPSWTSGIVTTAYALALGDINGDGRLDLVVGTLEIAPEGLPFVQGLPNFVLLNTGNGLESTPSWTSDEAFPTRGLALGDVNGDGLLDLAVANDCKSQVNNCHSLQVYLNVGGTLETTASWTSSDGVEARSVAWGDMDGDGLLDLAVGYFDGPNRVYRNVAGVLSKTELWTSADNDKTRSVAWGDMNGDGLLDLAAGNSSMNADGTNKVYLNVGGMLEKTAAWTSGDASDTLTLSWGDMNGDGLLDLAAGNHGTPDRVYRNVDGMLQSAAWNSGSTDQTRGLGWGDVDGDGDLDLAMGVFNGPSKVYLNVDGALEEIPFWKFGDSNTLSVAWGDLNGDGLLDLATGVRGGPIKIYFNQRPANPLYPHAHPPGIVIHLNSDPVTTAMGMTTTALAPANFFSQVAIRSDGVIPITYTLYHPGSEPFREVRGFYSLNGGDNWIPAAPTSATLTTQLASGPYPTQTVTNTHVFEWDVFASDFFGQSDHVVFRLEALPYLGALPNRVPGPFQTPFVSAATFPFRVRGTQVQVLSDAIPDTQPAANAVVYRRLAGQNGPAQAIANQAGIPYRTNAQGYLQGYGPLETGDTLFALYPVFVTDTHTLYHTNISPTLSGAAGYTVMSGGVQQVVVSADHPLILFNLDVSLEWDARNDAAYLEQLQTNLQRASELLFDWTNGQAALGPITIHHAREYWDDAHIRIYASNRLRPLASQGGLIAGVLTETVILADNFLSGAPLTSTNVITYVTGQVHIPATWNRFGEPGGSLAEDWPRTLAHELGHYLLYLDDNYLGLDGSGQLISITTCPGAMADQYSADDLNGYDEFHPEKDWLPACKDTFSNLETGRSDWETITTFYPALHPPVVENFPEDNFFGPNSLPLAVTPIAFVSPVTDTTTLPVPIFYLFKEDGGGIYFSSGSAAAFLFHENRLIDLGGLTGIARNQVLARGASPGDKLCVFDHAQSHLGCMAITATGAQLIMHSLPDWQPDLIVTPVTSRTVQVQLTLAEGAISGETIYGQLYPSSDLPPAGAQLFTQIGNVYSATFSSEEPVPLGAVHVWVSGTVSETVSSFAIGGNPGFKHGSGGFKHGSGGFKHGSGALVFSSDGQAAIFSQETEFQEGQFYILQTTPRISTPPPWATVVGQAYRLTGSEDAPDFDNAWISIGYLNREVPPGETVWLRVYYHAGQQASAWQILPTNLVTNLNYATAPVQGPGVYVLMSSVEIGLIGPSWNIVGYPILGTRPIREALASIKGAYNRVCHYDPTDLRDHWKCFGANVPPWVNDLHEMVFGQGYWIYAKKTITWYLKGAAPLGLAAAVQEELHSLIGPPATYYGVLTANSSFTPQPGMVLTAWVDGNLCGEADTFSLNGETVFVIDVASAFDPRNLAGCGLPGKTVHFRVNGYGLLPDAVWNDIEVWETPLAFGNYWIYIPIINRP